ncbi:MAG: cyclic nucleotide-binding domain-containing protein [Elusimicrobiota bacterium]
MDRFENLIPKLVPYETVQYGKDRSVFKNPETGSYLLISNREAQVIKSIDGIKSVRDHLEHHWKTEGENFSIRTFYNLIIELYINGFLCQENERAIERMRTESSLSIPSKKSLKSRVISLSDLKYGRKNLFFRSFLLKKILRILASPVCFLIFILLSLSVFFTLQGDFSENIFKWHYFKNGKMHFSTYGAGFLFFILNMVIFLSFQNFIKLLFLLRCGCEIKNPGVRFLYGIPHLYIDASDAIMGGPFCDIACHISRVFSPLFLGAIYTLFLINNINFPLVFSGPLAAFIIAIYEIRPFKGNHLLKALSRIFSIPRLTDHSSSYLKKRFLSNFFSFKKLFRGEWLMIVYACYFVLWNYLVVHYVLGVGRNNLPMLLEDARKGNAWAILILIAASLFVSVVMANLVFVFMHNLYSAFRIKLQTILRNVKKTGEENYSIRDNMNKIIRSVPLFSELDDDEISSLSRLMRVENYPAETNIILQGEYGDRFYIIFSGSVGVYRELDSGIETLEAVLSQGDSFGEIALVEKIPRTATVRAMTYATFLSLHKRFFNAFVQERVEAGQSVTEIIRLGQFLKNVSFFEDMPPEQISKIIRRLKKHSVKAGDIVIAKGEKGERFYIVKNGELSVYEDVTAKPVARLKERDVFGEIALIYNMPRTATVKADVDSALLVLEKDEFFEVLNSNIFAGIYLEDLSAQRLEKLHLQEA